MKTRFHVKLLSAALLSVLLASGCADQSAKSETASKASPEATAAITNASDAIAIAKSNDWIWRDTESFLSKAKAAADSGDNTTAIKLANKARFQAEAAVKQYNYEKSHPRGLNR